MSVGVVGSRYAVLGGEAIQERHGRIADDATEVLIFFDHDEDVIEARHLRAGNGCAEKRHKNRRCFQRESIFHSHVHLSCTSSSSLGTGHGAIESGKVAESISCESSASECIGLPFNGCSGQCGTYLPTGCCECFSK